LGNIHLGALLPAALFARLATLAFLAWGCRRHLTHGQPVAFGRGQAAKLLRFGGWITVSAFVGPMMVVLDRFIIGATAGANAVAYYTVPFQLADRTTLISRALASVLFPRFAALNRDQEQRLARKGFGVLVVFVTPLAATGILFIEPFFAWWIAPEFAQRSSLVGQIILLGFWINSFARIPFAQLQARGRPDIVAKCHLAELLPYFGLLYLGLHLMGLVGAAIAFSLRVVFDYALLSGFAGTLLPSLILLALPSALLTSATIIATQSEYGSLPWIVLVPTHLILTSIWAWSAAPVSVRRLSKSLLKREGQAKNVSTPELGT